MGLEDLFFQNTDMVLYLFLVQSLSVLAFYSVEQKIDVICRYVLASQIVLIGLFYCVWGGYGVDSRDYLTGFDGSPFVFGKEYLFWMVGYKLNKLFVDPWPLKLLSTLSVIILCLAILIYFKEKKIQYRVVALYVLLLVPSFYFLFGNAVRQGLAGSLVVLGLVYLHRGHKPFFVVATIMAILIHQASLVLAIAGLLARLNIRIAFYLLMVTPVVGVVVYYGASLFGLELLDYIPYAKKQEGQFHWSKIFIAYAIAIPSFMVTRESSLNDRRIIASYVYMVSFSSAFLMFEVPFERLLGFSELLLPFIAVIVINSLGWKYIYLLGFWVIGQAVGLLLWQHPSVIRTLGYASG